MPWTYITKFFAEVAETYGLTAGFVFVAFSMLFGATVMLYRHNREIQEKTCASNNILWTGCPQEWNACRRCGGHSAVD